jgi:hypothetical protein
MSREAHVRTLEGAGVRFPHATRLLFVISLIIFLKGAGRRFIVLLVFL